MDLTKIPNLITDKESQELFVCQNEIINNLSLSNEEKLIRLAIIQTLSPVEDWESAAQILKEHIFSFESFNFLIGTFISLTAFELMRYENIDYFISLLDDKILTLQGELLSVAYYIKAKFLVEKEGNTTEAVELLKRSVDIGPNFVMNFVELSNYVDIDSKKRCYQKACSNVRSYYKDQCNVISLQDLIDPLKFYNERIIQIDINWYAYQDMICLAR